MNMIEAAIKNYYGERCPDHDADCVVCQAWQEFDTIEYVHKPMSVNRNELTSAICDLHDIENAIKSWDRLTYPKDNDGTEITIGDCINDIMEFLTNLETHATGEEL